MCLCHVHGPKVYYNLLSVLLLQFILRLIRMQNKNENSHLYVHHLWQPWVKYVEISKPKLAGCNFTNIYMGLMKACVKFEKALISQWTTFTCHDTEFLISCFFLTDDVTEIQSIADWWWSPNVKNIPQVITCCLSLNSYR